MDHFVVKFHLNDPERLEAFRKAVAEAVVRLASPHGATDIQVVALPPWNADPDEEDLCDVPAGNRQLTDLPLYP